MWVSKTGTNHGLSGWVVTLRPLTPTDIRNFLGLEGYYQRFVDGFVSIKSPLTTLTQKSKKFEWSKSCERSF